MHLNGRGGGWIEKAISRKNKDAGGGKRRDSCKLM